MPLPANHKAFSLSLSHIQEPTYYIKQAMQCELDAPKADGTWIAMRLPANSHAIEYKWVYKVKLNSDIYSLFTKSTKNGGFIALIVYVDDIVIGSTSMQLRNEEKNYSSSKFKLKDLGKLKYFPGLEYMDKPSEANLKVGFRVLKYLKGVPGQGILLSIESDLNLQGYNSNDWVGCLDTRRSTEAKNRAMAATCCEVMWLIFLLKDVHIEHLSALRPLWDNQQVVAEHWHAFPPPFLLDSIVEVVDIPRLVEDMLSKTPI
ncbi:Uncharacterized protein TCM_032416 [Theobroma cacao]|uniref:Reverse transcriptase Ty1/copia-type domain-containing protein n=1 Tax=Theobroma cacao TaxID=3641 RepID=A0A061F9S4_THECC|nr:Uncharacterized protein TCM_032416 [Theobroma cacao]